MNPAPAPTPNLDDTLAESLKDIRPLAFLQDPIPSWLWQSAVAALLILGLTYLAWTLSQRRKRAKLQLAAIPLAPMDWFLQSLTALKPLKEVPIDYCYQLSFLFREYLERQFGFPATDRTSEELLVQLRRQNLFDDLELKALRESFEKLDFSKYAHQLPSLADLEQLESTLKQLVIGRQQKFSRASHESLAL